MDLLTYAHNLISKPHSVPTYTPYTTELVVAGSMCMLQHKHSGGFQPSGKLRRELEGTLKEIN